MDIVVDTSVIIAVVANEPEKESLIRATVGADLLAPTSCHWEVGNAFSAMLRRRRITLAQARQALETYQRIPLRFINVDLVEALELADRLGIYAYDAYVISCSLSQRCALISLDQGLVSAAQAAGAKVVEVTA